VSRTGFLEVFPLSGSLKDHNFFVCHASPTTSYSWRTLVPWGFGNQVLSVADGAKEVVFMGDPVVYTRGVVFEIPEGTSTYFSATSATFETNEVHTSCCISSPEYCTRQVYDIDNVVHCCVCVQQ